MLPVCMGVTDEKQNEDGRNKNFWRPRKRFAAILYREHTPRRVTKRHSYMIDEVINENPLTNVPEFKAADKATTIDDHLVTKRQLYLLF